MKSAVSSGIELPELLLRSVAFVEDGVLILHLNRRIAFCNTAFTQMTGYAPGDILGRQCDILHGPNTDPATIHSIAKALDAGRIFSGEILNYQKNGQEFWNSLTLCPYFDAWGSVTHYIAILLDITARKQAEAERAANVHRQYSLLNYVEAGILIHEPNGDIISANETAARLLGRTVEEIIGMSDGDPGWALMREDGSPMPQSEIPSHRAASTGKMIRNQVVGLRRGGADEISWLICNAHPARDSYGALQEVVVSFTDITELKQAERALQKSEERLRLILQGSSDAPWDIDLLAGSAYYSPRWWQMVGHDATPEISDPALWISLLDPQDHARVTEYFNAALRDGITAFEIEYRLRHCNGASIPVLSRAFILRDAQGTPIRVSGTNTDLTQAKAAEARIKKFAFYDPLTELPNRRLLRAQLQKALFVSLRTTRQGALLLLNLDHFKLLNDSHGHDVGDQLLQQVAGRLLEVVGNSDTVARLGGDEYLIMVEDLPTNLNEAAIAAEKIGDVLLARIAMPYDLNGTAYRCTASMGVALFGKGVQGVDGLLRQADLAMQRAKQTSTNTLRFFDISMQTAVEERLLLENDLRRGIEREEMVLYFQPQVIGPGFIVGAEVLLRWQHPTRGMIMPFTFIPLAEESGLILALGRWVLHETCRQLVAWAADPLFCDLSLSVNISIRQFREPDFVAQVLSAIEQTGADPARLVLELTESLFVDAMDDIVGKMNLLKAKGVRLSLDDFGTGYSSLAYLQRMPLDELKIDRSFVNSMLTDRNSATIASIIIDLANKLSLGVIAEGVETEEQRRFLADHGCINYQGYLFGRPQPLAQFAAAVGKPTGSV
jgi:diguanylate cyclase (GGDEF)-like protein/PAS domain S-box-containing protein